MKIQDRLIFFSALFGGGGLALLFLIKACGGGALIDWAWRVLNLGLAGFGFHISLSREAYEKYRKGRTRSKIVWEKAYGRFAPAAPYGSLILMLFAAVCAMVLPNQPWPIFFFLLLAVIYAVWLLVSLMEHTEKRIERSGGDHPEDEWLCKEIMPLCQVKRPRLAKRGKCHAHAIQAARKGRLNACWGCTPNGPSKNCKPICT